MVGISYFAPVSVFLHLGLHADFLRITEPAVCLYENLCTKLQVSSNIWAGSNFDLVGLEVTCSPRDLRFAGSNPTEVEFFQDVKIPSTSPPGGTLSWGSRV